MSDDLTFEQLLGELVELNSLRVHVVVKSKHEDGHVIATHDGRLLGVASLDDDAFHADAAIPEELRPSALLEERRMLIGAPYFAQLARDAGLTEAEQESLSDEWSFSHVHLHRASFRGARWGAIRSGERIEHILRVDQDSEVLLILPLDRELQDRRGQPAPGASA